MRPAGHPLASWTHLLLFPSRLCRHRPALAGVGLPGQPLPVRAWLPGLGLAAQPGFARLPGLGFAVQPLAVPASLTGLGHQPHHVLATSWLRCARVPEAVLGTSTAGRYWAPAQPAGLAPGAQGFINPQSAAWLYSRWLSQLWCWACVARLLAAGCATQHLSRQGPLALLSRSAGPARSSEAASTGQRLAHPSTLALRQGAAGALSRRCGPAFNSRSSEPALAVLH